MGALFSLNTVHIQPEDNHEENNPQTQVLNPEQVVYNFPINSQSLKTSLGSVPESVSNKNSAWLPTECHTSCEHDQSGDHYRAIRKSSKQI